MDQERRRADDIQIKVLEERVNLWMESTTEYRKSLCQKQDFIIQQQGEIISRLDRLPCDARKPMWQWTERNIYALWSAVALIFVAIMVEWIKRR